jgi:hypothetical protein
MKSGTLRHWVKAYGLGPADAYGSGRIYNILVFEDWGGVNETGGRAKNDTKENSEVDAKLTFRYRADLVAGLVLQITEGATSKVYDVLAVVDDAVRRNHLVALCKYIQPGAVIIGTPVTQPSELGYVHTQSVASTTWIINHNLGYIPSVELVDAAGVEFNATVTHTNVNQTIVTILVATAGIARLL